MATKKRRRTNQHRQRAQVGAAPTAPRAEERSAGDPSPDGRGRAASRPPETQRRTRAERKDLARAERDRIRRMVARRQRARRFLWLVSISVVAAAIVLFVNRPRTTTPVGQLPGLLTTRAPWGANSTDALTRASDVGLPAEGSLEHIHANLRIFVHGKQETVPQGIGISGSNGTSLHTHDTSGTIHVESSKVRAFTLGEFFDVWGVRFTSSCLGGYCTGGSNRLQVFVGGQEQAGDPGNVVLHDHDVIVVTFGTGAELPNPIPATFDFNSVPQ